MKLFYSNLFFPDITKKRVHLVLYFQTAEFPAAPRLFRRLEPDLLQLSQKKSSRRSIYSLLKSMHFGWNHLPQRSHLICRRFGFSGFWQMQSLSHSLKGGSNYLLRGQYVALVKYVVLKSIDSRSSYYLIE